MKPAPYNPLLGLSSDEKDDCLLPGAPCEQLQSSLDSSRASPSVGGKALNHFNDNRPPPSASSVRSLPWTLIAGTQSDVLKTAQVVDSTDTEESGVQRPSFPYPIGGWGKRVLDILVASCVLIVLSPLMLGVALLIRMTMGGPVFFAHPRIGMSGKRFDCLKFRTMVNSASEVLEHHLAENFASAEEWRRTRKLFNDPRVTPIGRLLRRSSLDELPQLFNVLRGDMSCVGPRPIVDAELESYGENAREYLSARPGMTGIWQVSGRNSLSYGNRVRLDTLYVRHWSLLLDLVILLKTVPALLKMNDTA